MAGLIPRIQQDLKGLCACRLNEPEAQLNPSSERVIGTMTPLMRKLFTLSKWYGDMADATHQENLQRSHVFERMAQIASHALAAQICLYFDLQDIPGMTGFRKGWQIVEIVKQDPWGLPVIGRVAGVIVVARN